jgi:hypothetical protein
MINKKWNQMKSPFAKFGIILFIIGLVPLCCTEGWGRDWKHYETNEEGLYFYDAESMTRLSKDIARVCVQSIYTEKGISQWIEGGGKEFENLDFSLVWYDFNCTEKSIRHLRIIFYSKSGEVFFPVTDDEWELFAPNPMLESLFREVCK